MNGALSEVEHLLQTGRDPNAEWQHIPAAGYALLHPNVFELLLDYGADVHKRCNGLPLLLVATVGVRQIRALLSRGVSVDTRAANGFTALMMAAVGNNTESLAYLIQCGADLNLRDEDSFTALMLAAGNGAPECVRLLLEAGADWTMVDADGQSALDHANIAEDEGARAILQEWIRGHS